jgi:hypothetical protein
MKKEILYLVPIEGDMSKNGISSYNSVIPFDATFLPVVSEYLKASLEYDLHCKMLATQKDIDDTFIDMGQQLYIDVCAWDKVLVDLGIFLHKYHTRTTWTVVYKEQVEDYGDFKISHRAINRKGKYYKKKEVA